MSLKIEHLSDTKGNEPLHRRILNDVQEKIISGAWPPGHRIPFETDMAKEYGCSRMTVNKALTQLSRAGLLVRNRKSGTFVNTPQSQSAAMEITSIRSEVEKSGKDYSYRLLSDQADADKPEYLDHLSSTAFCNIRKVTCLHFANSTPFCFEERVISLDAVPQSGRVSFEHQAPGAWLFKTVPWDSAEHQISACAASGDVAKALALAPGAACLVVERVTQNEKGYVTWARLSYPADRHRLCASFTPAG